MKLTVVSGRSGAGKSIALRVLEDLGYYCVDNLPIELLKPWITMQHNQHENVAVSLDMRNLPNDRAQIEQLLKVLKTAVPTTILYLDADDSILLRRYSETRRRHPLTKNELTLADAVAAETSWLEPVREQADLFLDTSHSTIYDFSATLRERLSGTSKAPLVLVFESFGFKHGTPNDADFVFDVRFLPNPYWEPGLRSYTGNDQPVIEFFDQHSNVEAFIAQVESNLKDWLPQLEKNDRSYVTVAIGCTGGCHRSVHIANRLADLFRSSYQVQLRHRNLQYKKTSV
ncbi:RNase adapter RapZ [Echinimonas agarilytica]|uniref:RNase adapter RapZ n=1 Tax=Echinimonas agarilytica TaxID=1215918 RepID=A0AA42B6J5_9GAMM|nr:RNase adapter RapZ [Echinimonas agarilytica]MCM2678608.1 RNase adapter RapZ [Echinimonas agarilytica]